MSISEWADLIIIAIGGGLACLVAIVVYADVVDFARDVYHRIRSWRRKDGP